MKTMSELQIQGARFYPIDVDQNGGKPLWLPSVTSQLDMWPKPALVPWAAKSEKEGILDDLLEWASNEGAVGALAVGARIEKMRKDPLRYLQVSKKATDIGSSAHDWIEWHLRGRLNMYRDPEPTLVPGADRAAEEAIAWMDSVNLIPLEVEKRVYDLEHGYAGRLDLKAEIDWKEDGGTTRRVIAVIDWKSSKGIYDDMKAQNMAYRAADFGMGGPNPPEGGVIVRLAKEKLDPVPFEAVQVPYDKAMLDAFYACCEMWTAIRTATGLWCGGYASEEEVEALRKRKGSRHKAGDKP